MTQGMSMIASNPQKLEEARDLCILAKVCMACQHLHLVVPASKGVREWIAAVLNHPFCDNVFGNPRKLNGLVAS
jgi:hypothetical protein